MKGGPVTSLGENIIKCFERLIRMKGGTVTSLLKKRNIAELCELYKKDAF